METGMDQLRAGVPAKVLRIDTTPSLRKRLRDFGMVPGTAVVCRYWGPGRKVAAIGLKGTAVALRTRDLKKIRVRW